LIPDAKSLPDTDWHIPQLYDFAEELGASTLAAEYSRFVIDLNRPSDDKPLYAGATTGLYPATLFDGMPLFREGLEPSKEERATYLEQIWTPYHRTLQQELARLKAEFGYALLFDAHSIRSVIPHLFDGKLPDFNLGTFNGASCDPQLATQLEAICARHDPTATCSTGASRAATSPAITATRPSTSTPCNWSCARAPTWKSSNRSATAPIWRSRRGWCSRRCCRVCSPGARATTIPEHRPTPG
jgi:N-formylglutamate amidohydrolase